MLHPVAGDTGVGATLRRAGHRRRDVFLLPEITAGQFLAGGGLTTDASANKLIVYGPVPGLPPSEHYAVRVRTAGGDAPWQSAFVFKTACKDFGRNVKGTPEGYWGCLSGWSHSYVNFETAGPVEVEIAKLMDMKPEEYARHKIAIKREGMN